MEQGVRVGAGRTNAEALGSALGLTQRHAEGLLEVGVIHFGRSLALRPGR